VLYDGILGSFKVAETHGIGDGLERPVRQIEPFEEVAVADSALVVQHVVGNGWELVELR